MEQLDHEKIRTVDVVCRDDEGHPLMAYQLRVDPANPRAVSCEVTSDIPSDPFERAAMRPILDMRRSFTLKAPLAGAEIRMGPAVEDTILCRWDDVAETYVPIFASAAS